MAVITGCLAHGWSRQWACCGRPDTGAGAGDFTRGTLDTGDRTSVSMAELTTDSVTVAWDLWAANGAGGAFYYNRYVTNVSGTSVTHVYNRTVVNNSSTTSFNGGTGGVQAHPTAQEQAAEHEQHQAPLASQTQHEHAASQNRENFASENHGRPAVAATARPGDFSSHSAVPARSSGGEYHAPAMSPKEARVASPAAGNKGNAKTGSTEGFKSFTPPSKSGTTTGGAKTSHWNETGPNANHSSATHTNQSHPQSQSHVASQPRPKASPRPSSPAPKRQSAPPAHHGK